MVKRKTYRIIWDEDALYQLQEYLAYVHRQSPSAPGIIRDRLLEKLDTISTNPFICEDDRLKENNNGMYKAFIVYSYRITYKITDASVNVIRVRHTSKEPLEY
jgi:addiction module RelE/StbE family toxin